MEKTKDRANTIQGVKGDIAEGSALVSAFEGRLLKGANISAYT